MLLFVFVFIFVRKILYPPNNQTIYLSPLSTKLSLCIYFPRYRHNNIKIPDTRYQIPKTNFKYQISYQILIPKLANQYQKPFSNPSNPIQSNPVQSNPSNASALPTHGRKFHLPPT
ncbi:hypothetical protein OCU04_007764 [Sclerotinia nivalis]|uniref:Uncharacterized protein n=1 Tax=Sclerotinia nivalis TaxID=352851 RepID=A0A9X0AJF3_9HELO|nr:hypothetical protein OCU04_007764 [Sclerotinia nivalis]